MGFSYKKTTNYSQGKNEAEGYSLSISGYFPNHKMNHSKIKKLSLQNMFLDDKKQSLKEKIEFLKSNLSSNETTDEIKKITNEITNINQEQERIKNEISEIMKEMDDYYKNYNAVNNIINDYDYSLYSGSELSFSTPIETKEFSVSETEVGPIENVNIRANADYYSIRVIFIDRLSIPRKEYTLNFIFSSARFGENKRVELIYSDSDESFNYGYVNRFIEWHRTDGEFYDDDMGYWERGSNGTKTGAFTLEECSFGTNQASVSAFINSQSGIKKFEGQISISDGDNFNIFIKTTNISIVDKTDAGFIISDRYGSLESLENEIFTDDSPSYSRKLFRELNAETTIRPGSMLILAADPSFDQKQISQLINSRDQVNHYLDLITEEKTDHDFFYKNYKILANFLEIAEKGTDLAGVAGSEYFKQIEKIINNINTLYKSSFESMGAITGDVFYAQRRQLFSKLETLLKKKFLRSTMKLPNNSKIKKTLSLSTKSIVHHWKASGVTDLPGYSTHIARAAKMNTIMKRVGYAGIAFSGLGSINTIYKSCSSGRENECKKTTFTEIGSFSLGVVGGTAFPALCLALSFTPLGAIACSVILSLTGSTLGSIAGEFFGNKIYEATNDE